MVAPLKDRSHEVLARILFEFERALEVARACAQACPESRCLLHESQHEFWDVGSKRVESLAVYYTSLVQPHLYRPRLVVSRSTCPPYPPPPHANSFVLGPAV